MGNDLKETPYAPASEAEIPQVAPGEASQSPGHEDAARRGMPAMQEPAPGSPRLPDLRDVPEPRSHRAPESRTRRLTTSGDVEAQFLTFGDDVRKDLAFVFPGQGAQFVG